METEELQNGTQPRPLGSTWTELKPLPEAWISRLHVRMMSIYGHKFQSLFPDAESMADWRDTWGRALAGVSGDQIATGLAKLATGAEGWPPSSGEFRALCVPPVAHISHQRHPLLDAPKVEYKPRDVKALIPDMGRANKDWARELKAMEESGKKLLYCQSRAWREALNRDPRQREIET